MYRIVYIYNYICVMYVYIYMCNVCVYIYICMYVCIYIYSTYCKQVSSHKHGTYLAHIFVLKIRLKWSLTETLNLRGSFSWGHLRTIGCHNYVYPGVCHQFAVNSLGLGSANFDISKLQHAVFWWISTHGPCCPWFEWHCKIRRVPTSHLTWQ